MNAAMRKMRPRREPIFSAHVWTGMRRHTGPHSLACFLLQYLSAIPAVTPTITTARGTRIDRIGNSMFSSFAKVVLTYMSHSSRYPGIAKSVEKQDIAIDIDVFPFTQYVSRLEVEPPGADPVRITPIAV